MSVGAEKGRLRDAMRARLGAISADDRRSASGAIVDRITGSGWWKGARCVLVFAWDSFEPDLDPLIEVGNRHGKVMAMPWVDWAGKSMRGRRVRSASDLVEGRHGIRVPGEGCDAIGDDEIDLVLVPGVAFDRVGGRLGRGAGFYDRFLASWRDRPMTGGGVRRLAVGVGFATQVVELVPTDPHDERLDGLVTDAGGAGVGMEVPI